MEQQYSPLVQNYQPEIKQKRPVFVAIVSWLMLLDGIGNLLLTAPILLLGGIGKSAITLGLGGLTLIRGIGLVVVSFGVRHMRRWALYTFTGLAALAVIAAIYSFATSPTRNFTDLADVGIEVLVLVYLWAISKRFG